MSVSCLKCVVCDVLCDDARLVVVCVGDCVRLKHDCVLRVMLCDVGWFGVVCVIVCVCVCCCCLMCVVCL